MTGKFFVYILSNRAGFLYTGITNNLENRVLSHKQKRTPGYTARYTINRLVYYEAFAYVHDAIQREKQIKGWRCEKKLELIQSINPTFEDLSKDWDH